MEAGGDLELILVQWPLPECPWRLEGPRVDACPVVTVGMFMEAEGGVKLILVLWPLP